MIGHIYTVPADMVERAREFGAGMGVEYKKDTGSYKPRIVADWSDEEVREARIASRLSELVFCMAAGLDPLDPKTELNWDLQRGLGGDPDYDVVLAGWRVDVKHTAMTGHFLIWPLNKNHKYDKAQFDFLALVKMDGVSGAWAGFASKSAFSLRHQTAGPGHKLKAGTWYMHEDDLTGYIGP